MINQIYKNKNEIKLNKKLDDKNFLYPYIITSSYKNPN
jgi:hypothetical protein